MLNYSRSFVSILCLTSCAAFLSSCAPKISQSPSQHSAADYLSMAQNAQTPTDKTTYQLRAAQAFLNERNITQAQALLNQINQTEIQPTPAATNLDQATSNPTQVTSNENTPPPLINHAIQSPLHTLVQADYNLLTHQTQEAIAQLKSLSPADFQPQDRYTYTTLLARAYQQNKQWAPSILFYNQLIKESTTPQAQERWAQQCWSLLMGMPTDALDQFALQKDSSSDFQGWIDLALIARNANKPLAQRNLQLQEWEQLYPHHPARMVLPKQTSTTTIQPVTQVALLLPLTGPYQGTSQAIQNGFFSAYYANKKNTSSIKKVEIYDTTAEPVAKIYHQAITDGAQFVIGPLTKANLQKLVSSDTLAVPTLALNRLPSSQRITNLYQFGLSPLDEAQQVANQAWKTQHHRALVFVPVGQWGTSIGQRFINSWRQLGGQIADEIGYDPNYNLKPQVANLLKVDASEQRYRSLKQALGVRLRYIPRRRTDADMLFIAATPPLARQIKPLLNYYFAGNMATYGISSIYNGQSQPRSDRDLNGIQFPDMPWVLGPDQNLPQPLIGMQKDVASLWKQNYQQHTKLYALGIDSFNLINQINSLNRYPDIGIFAATGILSMDKEQQINRQLIWAQVKDGQVVAAETEQQT